MLIRSQILNPSLILKGMSQIMLQESKVVGLLFIVGVFVSSWIAGIGAIFGILVSTITAFIFKYNYKDIQSGLYGFNGALVGIGMFTIYSVDKNIIVLTALGAILSSVIMHIMHEKKLMPFTFPFVLSCWLLILITGYMDIIRLQDAGTFSSLNIITGINMSFSQVMLQANIITGLLFFLALLYISGRVAFYALLGAIVGTTLAYVLSLPSSLVIIGIYGFNGVLCGIALMNTKKYPLLFASIGIIISTLLIHLILKVGIIPLTFPFVFATWITLAIIRLFKS